jgi:nicotinamidase-related amidase
VATAIGVDSTARAAHERGYNLTFARDAMTDLDAATHEHCLLRIFPRLGEIDGTDAILRLVPAAPQ